MRETRHASRQAKREMMTQGIPREEVMSAHICIEEASTISMKSKFVCVRPVRHLKQRKKKKKKKKKKRNREERPASQAAPSSFQSLPSWRSSILCVSLISHTHKPHQPFLDTRREDALLSTIVCVFKTQQTRNWEMDVLGVAKAGSNNPPKARSASKGNSRKRKNKTRERRLKEMPNETKENNYRRQYRREESDETRKHAGWKTALFLVTSSRLTLLSPLPSLL